MPLVPKASSKPAKGTPSTATIGSEQKLWLTANTALRDSATLRCEANLRSLSETKDNRSNNMDAAKTSGASKTAPGNAKGERGGVHQFYTPSCVVRLLVEMLAPHPNSRIYDPACGSGGMVVQWKKFLYSPATETLALAA